MTTGTDSNGTSGTRAALDVMSDTETVNLPLAGLPEARADAEPHAPALADDAVTLDNAAFADRVARAAALLARLGVGPGDVVAISLPNRLELIISLFAAWRLGAAATPVNPALTRAEMQYQVDDAGAKLVIGDGLALDAPVVEVAWLADEPALPTAAADVAPDALALLIYTSGTTGKPKGVMLDHANVAAMCAMTQTALGITAADHSLLILPLFHVNGIIAGTLSPLLAGGRVNMLPRAHLRKTSSWYSRRARRSSFVRGRNQCLAQRSPSSSTNVITSRCSGS